MKCKNCGSSHIVEENGIATCKACETKYPNLALKNIGLEEELKEKEIKRLIEVNRKIKIVMGRRRYSEEIEPIVDILTDDEILKYSPDSCAAARIKAKKTGSIINKLKGNNFLREMWR